MSDPESLVERLNAHSRDPLGSATERDCREAAAELSALRERCETAERERDEAEHYRSEWERVCGDWKQATLDANTRAEAAEAARDEAVAALEPFALEASEENGEYRTDWQHDDDREIVASIFCDLTFGDFRKAREVYRATQPAGKEKG